MRSSRSVRPDLARLIERPFAHRGLHGPGRLENSRAAFEAAIEAGFGIELDVQLSRDGEAMVFHDYALDRLTGEAGAVIERSAAELQRLMLKGMDETIPTLGEVLRLIAGRCGLLIEVKAPRRHAAKLSAAVNRALQGHGGEAAVMSFNPEVGRWFSRNAPDVKRGLVVTEENKRGLRGRVERAFSLWRSRANFLAYDIRDLPSPFAAATRARGLPVLTWTVRNRRDEERASVYADQIIHELPQGRG
ncbi:MAG TPA: glycerophosphodiester phosphodiesterase family protein [Allosphingosinicella sp.]|uniref:glycerophosphodiester phosphodiesterase family protein n=1 Tax=Allosphingosinicella sp. TaxID=2823234 RepID=UPI002EDADDA7